MNQIARTFVLIGLVVVILLAMHLLPQEQEVGGVELRHVNVLSDILPEVYQQRDGIDVIPVPDLPKPIQTERTEQKGEVAQTPVSSPKAKEEAVPQVSEKSVQANTSSASLLADYSEGGPGGMAHFYHKLSSVGSGGVVRIAYFGDSFVEGDILTCDLRELLQSQFGGSGVGWIDPVDRLGGFRQTVKQHFKGFTEYEVVKKPYNHKVEGISQRYFVPAEGGRTWASGSKFRKHLASWQHASLFLRTEEGVTVTPFIGNDTLPTVYVAGAPAVQMIAHERGQMTGVGYRFSDVTPQTYVYGMALESSDGVILDNFSMRGSAGFTIAQIPMQTLSDFARLRPYDLIVLHFGLNVASEKSHAANYKAYIKRMQTAIEHLRQAFPQASILVMSMPDRDQRTDAGIRTIMGVESLVAYQQILASNCHVAFFNLFQAMGGRESMKGLVDRGLANKDYTHLSFKGGSHIAKFIYDGLMADYNSYGHQ